MSPFTFTTLDTDDLDASLARDLVSLAADSIGPSFDPSYLARRFGLYPNLAIARDARGLAAAQFFDVRRRDETLVYLGPLFSRRGAYVRLFGHCVEHALARGEGFCLVMEIENPLVREVLSLVLPTHAWPRRGEPLATELRALARSCADAFPHVKDFDEASMTSSIEESAFGIRTERTRYDFVLVRCDDDELSRARLRAELARGIDSFDTMRWAKSAGEAVRERNLLRADP